MAQGPVGGDWDHMASPASKAELVQRFVLDSMADDYENLTVSIAGPVMGWGVDCGVTIEKSEIVQALRELVDLNWIRAYKLYPSHQQPDEFGRMPTLEEMEDPMGAWFDLTESGRKVQMVEYEGWPFEIDGTLRKDWLAPTR